ncbi:Acyltransferase [Ancylostoma caninum]|uniref:Acyltransferase n=1 Tax=Ancylostoma caninum TaxID=29170 RepID=A0A368FST3_ANCCA|nr:Acyltransferase [Ancylostoma caninum]
MLRSLFNLIRPLIGWIFGITILWSSLFGAYIISTFLILIILGRHTTWRSFMDRSVSFWMMVPIGFLELIFGMRVRVSGDEIEYDKPALIIMNHRTRLDWMYMWSALYQMNPWLITSNKISLKAQLQSLPGAGFGMSAAHFLFLQRNMEKDAVTFDSAIDYYKSMNNNYQLLLFPEGTDKSPWTTTKSLEYAKKHGLKPLKHLLYPRVAGFYHLLTKMREANFVSYVYDISIAYPYNIVQSEVDLILKGDCPREVHFHIKKILFVVGKGGHLRTILLRIQALQSKVLYGEGTTSVEEHTRTDEAGNRKAILLLLLDVRHLGGGVPRDVP